MDHKENDIEIRHKPPKPMQSRLWWFNWTWSYLFVLIPTILFGLEMGALICFGYSGIGLIASLAMTSRHTHYAKGALHAIAANCVMAIIIAIAVILWLIIRDAFANFPFWTVTCGLGLLWIVGITLRAFFDS